MKYRLLTKPFPSNLSEEATYYRSWYVTPQNELVSSCVWQGQPERYALDVAGLPQEEIAFSAISVIKSLLPPELNRWRRVVVEVLGDRTPERPFSYKAEAWLGDESLTLPEVNSFRWKALSFAGEAKY